MADSARNRPPDRDAEDCRTASPLSGKKKAQQSPGIRTKYQSSAPGHCLKRVTLTKPTFCHNCSDFIWGLVGFLCEVCNFMCHEKCLKTLRWACSCMTPSLVRVPVAHCFGPSGQKKRFCSVCRKLTEGNGALRCEVCELHVHADCAIFSCADCRSSHLDETLEQDTFHHHWREGNLASAARCDVCRRSCGSSDVLSGMRCEWCGVTSHASCYLGVPPECTLGRLRCMTLHPDRVRLHFRNFSKMHCYRIAESCSQELDDVDQNAAASKEATSKQLKVFDGDDAMKRGCFRLVSIMRAIKNEEVVEAALRAFYLPDDPQDFELKEVSYTAGPPCGSNVEFPSPWSLRVFPAVSSRSGAAVVSVSVSKESTAASVLSEVLSLLQRQVTLCFNTLNSCRRNRSGGGDQKYLLIGGLTPQLNRDEYVQLIQEQLTMKSHLVTLSHVYPSQGAVALQVSCFSEAERIYMLAKDTSVNNKALTSLVIAEIEHGAPREDVCPLLVFVNPKSGGMKGRELLYGFRKLLNPHQVFDISNGGPLAGLHTFREVPKFRVLVCGGDGTTGWVLGVLEAIRHKLVCREPPIGIVPLGTGNDLARVLRWGAGYGGEDPHHILVSVDEADEVLMDRWTILLDAQDISEDGKENGFLEPPKIVQMNNYFGLGIDADVSLDFHQAREDEPDKFTSRFHNKGVYVKVGLQKISATRSLHKELRLQVDGRDVPLPHIEGLIFLNIPSWGSGADLWGSEVDVRHGKPRIDDGMLEVVGVTGVVHMGQVQSGLRSGIRIAQGTYIRLTVNKPIPVQVDGEPWIQSPGHIIISAAGPKVRMLKKSKQKQKKSSAGSKDKRSESPSSKEGGH
uniref:Diacylglycerol kinase n=1 Tax=Gasterosteus aculeatus aculeatus TaxID=481459 RepID=A0AAQ4R4D7_GASAC